MTLTGLFASAGEDLGSGRQPSTGWAEEVEGRPTPAVPLVPDWIWSVARPPRLALLADRRPAHNCDLRSHFEVTCRVVCTDVVGAACSTAQYAAGGHGRIR